jgi:hypothetical protein
LWKRPVSPLSHFEVTASAGGAKATTNLTLNSADSPAPDAVIPTTVHPSGTGFVGGVGTAAVSPLPSSPFPNTQIGLEANAFFFSGVNSTINGLPGLPFGLPGGADNIKIADNYLITAGVFANAPVFSNIRVGVTGGFAFVDKAITYNCVTFCTLGAPTPQFSASKSIGLPGEYIGARVMFPISGFPGAMAGFEYDHVFVNGTTFTVGNGLRDVGGNLSQGIDMFTAHVSLLIFAPPPPPPPG